METKIKLHTFMAALVVTMAVFSCSEDDVIAHNPKPTPGTVSSQVKFAQSQVTILENAPANEVVIKLDRPASKTGEIVINVVSQDLDLISTTPQLQNGKIKLDVAVGQSLLKFTVKPTDNSLLGGDRNIVFSIESVTAGLEIGSEKVMTATLKDDESPAAINFMLNLGSTRENADEGATVMLILSHPSPGAGVVEVSVDSDKAIYGTHYVTEPAAENNRITLPVEAGVDKLSFKVRPVNDNTVNGEREISYTLSGAQGAVILGTEVTHALLISDDELYGLPKSYTIAAGSGWSLKKSYEYDEQGRVSRVIRQQNSLVSTENYHYSDAGVLLKITESDFSETIFIYDNEGKVIKSEKYKDGILKAYHIFSYDPAGNVGEVAWFNRQPSGDIILSMVFVYLYYDHGNIYKRMVFNPVQNSEELVQVSEETYGGYMQKENLFPVYEIIPGKSTQPWLPTSYEYRSDYSEYSYTFTYVYDNAGRVIKRNVLRNGSIVESNGYEYY